MASGDSASRRWPHTERRLAPARRGSRPSLHLCRTGVLVGPAVSILVVLPGAVLRVHTATGHGSGAAGLRPGGARSGPAAAGLLVLLSQRRSLLSDHTDLPRSMGAGPTEARVASPKFHRSPSHFFFSRTSSRGADHGYGLISISAGSSTRGPIALGQLNSKMGPNLTRSWRVCWIWCSMASRFLRSVSRACCL